LSKKTLCTCSDQTSPTGPKGNCLRSTLWVTETQAAVDGQTPSHPHFASGSGRIS
jgi:hypothetical protein